MNLCSDGHDEVCYAGRECPACAAVKERDERINRLEEEIGVLEERVADLQDEAAAREEDAP